MKNLFIAAIVCLSFTALAQESEESLALNHVDKFVFLHGKESISTKKQDGKKYDKFRKKLAAFATPEVLDNVLNDDPSKETDLSFKLTILFAIESGINYTNKQFEKPVVYEVLSREDSAGEAKFLISGLRKMNFEVICKDREEKVLGFKTKKHGCLVTNVFDKDEQ